MEKIPCDYKWSSVTATGRCPALATIFYLGSRIQGSHARCEKHAIIAGTKDSSTPGYTYLSKEEYIIFKIMES